MNRSKRLKKIARVYKELEHRERASTQDISIKTESELNLYQQFMKEESKKEKYKNLKASERMAEIAKTWKRKRVKAKKKK